MGVCTCEDSAHRNQKAALCPLEMELYVVVSCSRWVLGTKFGLVSLVSGSEMAEQAILPGPMLSLAWPVWGEQESFSLLDLHLFPVENLRPCSWIVLCTQRHRDVAEMVWEDVKVGPSWPSVSSKWGEAAD